VVGRRRGLRRRRAGLTALLAATLTATGGCVADPPPPVEKPVETAVDEAVRQDSTIVVSMDGIGAGFNPHLLADRSPMTAAVAESVLPSPFRYRVDPEDPQGPARYVLDDDLLESAEVVSDDPMIVEYRLHNFAQWSDGAPIAAEDFRYLWQRMITEPGVIDPAPYRLISDVRAFGEGGKTVQVVFDRPYAQWERLFSGLLPAHLIKDTPGGFSSGLRDALPISGGHFLLSMVDRGRGEVLLRRNDRFWGAPAASDRIVIRRGGDPGAVARALREHDTQVVDMSGGPVLEATTGTVPGTEVTRRPAARVLAATLNARNPHLADDRVREALLTLLDPAQLALIGAGTTDAQAPGPPLFPVATTMSDEQARQVLIDAGADPVQARDDRRLDDETADDLDGEDLDTADSADGVEDDEDDGDAAAEELEVAVPTGGLPLLIAVPSGDAAARDVAQAVADVWTDAGVAVTVVSGAKARDSYGAALDKGTVGMIVDWQSAGVDPAAEIAARYGCRLSADETDEPADPAEPGPGNLGGLCDPALQPMIERALAGEIDRDKLYDRVGPVVSDFHTVLPILQGEQVVAVSDQVTDVAVHLPITAGLFVQPGLWARIEE